MPVEVDLVVEAGFARDVGVWGSGEDVDVDEPGEDVAVVVVPGSEEVFGEWIEAVGSVELVEQVDVVVVAEESFVGIDAVVMGFPAGKGFEEAPDSFGALGDEGVFGDEVFGGLDGVGRLYRVGGNGEVVGGCWGVGVVGDVVDDVGDATGGFVGVGEGACVGWG